MRWRSTLMAFSIRGDWFILLAVICSRLFQRIKGYMWALPKHYMCINPDSMLRGICILENSRCSRCSVSAGRNDRWPACLMPYGICQRRTTDVNWSYDTKGMLWSRHVSFNSLTSSLRDSLHKNHKQYNQFFPFYAVSSSCKDITPCKIRTSVISQLMLCFFVSILYVTLATMHSVCSHRLRLLCILNSFTMFSQGPTLCP